MVYQLQELLVLCTLKRLPAGLKAVEFAAEVAM
jgi:hypothetical protein